MIGTRDMTYRVTYAIDSLDPQPKVKTFDFEYEAIDWLNDERARRVDFIIMHSPYMVSEADRLALEETEAALSRVERVDQ
jgi:hypothetical protein